MNNNYLYNNEGKLSILVENSKDSFNEIKVIESKNIICPKCKQNAKIDIKTINKSGVKQSSNQIYYVVLHEVGHALGIKGHSKNRYDVMYPSDNTYRNALSNRDINTIKTIYK